MSMDSSYFDDEANASAFTKYHVRLPDEVYRYMASLCEPNNELSGDGPKVHSPNRKLAIDLACGSGHSTVPIAKYFQEVIGVDICRSQIECAPKDVPNIRYKVGPAECLEFVEDDSVDLVLTVAALHWLEVPRVYDEVKRVLRKGGVFCACDYRALSSSYDITEASALWHQVKRSIQFICAQSKIAIIAWHYCLFKSCQKWSRTAGDFTIQLDCANYCINL